MSEARAIQRRISRLLVFARSLDLLGERDAAALIRARARLWYRQLDWSQLRPTA